jgi:hypothetical protein
MPGPAYFETLRLKSQNLLSAPFDLLLGLDIHQDFCWLERKCLCIIVNSLYNQVRIVSQDQ